jgi:hypothetical protein
MKNQGFILAFFLSGLFLAGCSYDEGPVPGDIEPLNAKGETVLKSTKNHAVPFKSKFTCGGEEITPEEPDGLFHQMVYGSGNATHLGKTELLIPDEGINMDVFSNCYTENVLVILTTANGDELWLSYSSTFDLTPMLEDPPGVVYVRDAMGSIDGGTGRFENATGNIVYEGDWDISTGIGICSFNGEIQY